MIALKSEGAKEEELFHVPLHISFTKICVFIEGCVLVDYHVLVLEIALQCGAAYKPPRIAAHSHLIIVQLTCQRNAFIGTIIQVVCTFYCPATIQWSSSTRQSTTL